MDNNATFRRLKFTGLLLRSQWVIKLCSKGGIQMKKYVCCRVKMLTIVDLMKENRNDRRKSERYIKEI